MIKNQQPLHGLNITCVFMQAIQVWTVTRRRRLSAGTIMHILCFGTSRCQSKKLFFFKKKFTKVFQQPFKKNFFLIKNLISFRAFFPKKILFHLHIRSSISTGCSKMVDSIRNTHISETTRWIIMKLNTLYVEGHKFYWLNLQKKVQIFGGSMADFHKCSI